MISHGARITELEGRLYLKLTGRNRNERRGGRNAADLGLELDKDYLDTNSIDKYQTFQE